MEQRISLQDILAMERVPRLTLINTITGFKSANLIGTMSAKGVHNLAVFSSVVHIGSNPPYVGMITRPTEVPRHTYQNIKETGFYTINHIHTQIYHQAHQTSAKYIEAISEFEECGFTPQFTESIKAPYVQECHIKLGVQFEEESHIKANGTILVVGKVLEIILPDKGMEKDGSIDLESWRTIAISGLDTYLTTQKMARLPYARPKQGFKMSNFPSSS